MATRHPERCSTSLAIREMQIRTTASEHLTPTRTPDRNDRCRRGLAGLRGDWLPVLCPGVWQSVTRATTEPLCDPATAFPGVYPREIKTRPHTAGHGCSRQHYSQLPKGGSRSNAQTSVTNAWRVPAGGRCSAGKEERRTETCCGEDELRETELSGRGQSPEATERMTPFT